MFRHSVRVLQFDEEEKPPETRMTTTVAQQVVVHKRARPLPPPLTIIEEYESRAPLVDSKMEYSLEPLPMSPLPLA